MNGLPGSCAVFVPQNNIILPFGSSREIQEQEFPTDLQENFITVAVQLATLLRASEFLKQRKRTLCRHISEFETTSNSLILDKLTIVM